MSRVTVQPHPRLFALFGVAVFVLVVVGLKWLSPATTGAPTRLHVPGVAQIRVAASSADLDAQVRGAPSRCFVVGEGTQVWIVNSGYARAEIELPDGRHGWVPSEWVK